MRGAARRAPALAALLALGCAPGTTLARSCAGERVELCEPFEYAVVTAASFGPPELRVGDFSMQATVHVELDTCGADAPGPHRVEVLMLEPASGGPDGGASLSVVALATVRDDGAGGDPTAQDGVIDVTISNPFLATAPAETDVVLRFEPRRGRECAGEALEIPYRTGPPRQTRP